MKYIMDNMTEGVAMVSVREEEVVFTNAALERMYGFKPGQMIGRCIKALSSPKGADCWSVMRDMTSSPDQNVGWSGECRHFRQDGSHLLSRVRIVRGDDPEYGSVWIAFHEDITEQTEAYIELKRLQEKTVQINDALADTVFSVKMPERRIVYVNRAVREMFKYDVEEVIGQNTRLFYHTQEDYKAFGAQIEEAVRARKPKVLTHQRLRRKSGESFWASISTTFIYSEGELSQVISVVRDISALKELERELLHSKKMVAVGTLAGGVAHEINNVLAAILAYASAIDLEMDGTDPHKSEVEGIISATARGKNLIEGLLGFARKKTHKQDVILLNDIIQGLITMLEQTLPKKVRLEFQLDSELKPIRCDTSQMEAVLMNLCLNASDALDGAGTITIVTSNVTLTTDNPLALAAGSYVKVEIRDTGKGMDETTLERAFEPFFTTKGFGKGTGLGLFLVYNLVTNLNGAIELSSLVGEGTTVRILLPSTEATCTRTISEPAHQAQRKGRILLVDDEEMIRSSGARLLKALGYDVEVADGGPAAIDIFSRRGLEFDLVILDLSMPEMDGEECYAALREMDPNVRVLISTGHMDHTSYGDFFEDGIVGVLLKPYSGEDVRNAIEKAVLD